MVSSTSTSNVGLKVCTAWALMGQAQIPTISHQNLDHNITHIISINTNPISSKKYHKSIFIFTNIDSDIHLRLLRLLPRICLSLTPPHKLLVSDCRQPQFEPPLTSIFPLLFGTPNSSRVGCRFLYRDIFLTRKPWGTRPPRQHILENQSTKVLKKHLQGRSNQERAIQELYTARAK